MGRCRNVYEAALSRLEKIFSDFDNIYVSFSGGKDSGVLLNLCIDYIRKHKLKCRLGVFHMDYEVQYSATLAYVEKVLSENTDILDIYRVCVPFKVPTCTSMHQSYWRPWDEAQKELWVREMPRSAFRKEDFDFFSDDLWDYDFQIKFAEWLHHYKRAGRTCCLVGIRTQESFNRWRAIHSEKNYCCYERFKWTRKIADDVYNAYPIYDWRTTDVWVANGPLLPSGCFDRETTRCQSVYFGGNPQPSTLSGYRPADVGTYDKPGKRCEFCRYIR